MSAQRARSAVVADHRSAHPNFPGVPWWGAVLIAIAATAIGFAFDAGSGGKELSVVFAACYAIGCVAAVLAVRQAALFTAVIQPPLILFASVPGSYFLFTGSRIDGVKDVLINCGYPLIERFPLMFFTSAGVLLIGMLRWYYGMSNRRAAPRSTDKDTKPGPAAALAAKMSAKVSSLFARDADDEDEVAEAPRRRRTATKPGRPTRAATSNRGGEAARRSSASRSRHVRPPETEVIEPVAERPRRARTGRHGEPPPEPRRRPRTSNTRQPGPPPSEHRASYERSERRRRYDNYQPREPHGSNGNGTHHPITQVRYRGEEPDDRAEYRTRRLAPRDWEAGSREYEI